MPKNTKCSINIVYDQHVQVYHPGETVKGKVLLNLNEPMKMNGITIYLIGKCEVSWTKNGEIRKHYVAKEDYIRRSITLFTLERGQENHPAGNFTYPFQFSLPENLPSSYGGTNGKIVYLCKCIIETKLDIIVVHPFTVIRKLDLNREHPSIKDVVQVKCHNHASEVNLHFWKSGYTTCKYQINRRGFVPGENIVVDLIIQNDSVAKVNNTMVGLKRYEECHAYTQGMISRDRGSKTASADVVFKSQGKVKPHETKKLNFLLEIPKSAATSRLDGCDLINIKYLLKVYIFCNFGADMKVATDITIGNVPLRDTNNQPTTHHMVTRPTHTDQSPQSHHVVTRPTHTDQSPQSHHVVTRPTHTDQSPQSHHVVTRPTHTDQSPRSHHVVTRPTHTDQSPQSHHVVTRPTHTDQSPQSHHVVTRPTHTDQSPQSHNEPIERPSALLATEPEEAEASSTSPTKSCGATYVTPPPSYEECMALQDTEWKFTS